MGDANVWLLALAFLLGLALTFALMIRRAQRDVPGSPSVAVPPGGAAGFAGGRSGAESDPPAMPSADESAKEQDPS